jgi:pyrrolidone-carboxylate peptidase
MKYVFSICLGLASLVTMQLDAAETNLNVEELRLEKAMQAMPGVFIPLASNVNTFEQKLGLVNEKSVLRELVETQARKLWQSGTESAQTLRDYDDRPLYWARLQFRKALKQNPVFLKLSDIDQKALLWQFELFSRGQGQTQFSEDADIRILVTGFDPFFLDRNIDQSNPSGVAALLLHQNEISVDEQVVSIVSLVVPVRFADFDQGMIETLLAPLIDEVDMIATISMGRTEFDLERFPGRRRSAEAPDNLNVYTGANAKNPLIPLLNGQPIEGPEFVEFSLPVEAMQKATGDFQIIDNRKVSTLNGELMPEQLQQLDEEVAVTGGGGGYLSNEISYRSILLRDKLRPSLPVGHIHTPRIKAFEPGVTNKIVAQIRLMLVEASKAIQDAS